MVYNNQHFGGGGEEEEFLSFLQVESEKFWHLLIQFRTVWKFLRAIRNLENLENLQI